MLIIDQTSDAAAPKPSVFLHGVTGAGKSTWAVTGGRPLCILTEPKAQSILRTLNPNAIGLVPQSTDDLFQLFKLLADTEKLKSKGLDRIVLDSFTDLTYSIPAWMKGPEQILLKLEIQEFGDLKNWSMALVKAIQLSGYPSVIIARSTVKRFGRIEKIVPDGYGRSVEELPGKCLPTAECRYDSELGYVVDTSPDECSQRCGLPWVPSIWTGNCLDYLLVVAHGQPATEPEPAPVVVTAPPVDVNPAEVIQEIAAEKRTRARKPTPATEEFVEDLAPLAASAESIRELLDLAMELKVQTELGRYLVARGFMTAGNWNSLTTDGCAKATEHLKDEKKRRAFITHLKSNHAA